MINYCCEIELIAQCKHTRALCLTPAAAAVHIPNSFTSVRHTAAVRKPSKCNKYRCDKSFVSSVSSAGFTAVITDQVPLSPFPRSLSDGSLFVRIAAAVTRQLLLKLAHTVPEILNVNREISK